MPTPLLSEERLEVSEWRNDQEYIRQPRRSFPGFIEQLIAP
jgi:hypothetical protein